MCLGHLKINTCNIYFSVKIHLGKKFSKIAQMFLKSLSACLSLMFAVQCCVIPLEINVLIFLTETSKV